MLIKDMVNYKYNHTTIKLLNRCTETLNMYSECKRIGKNSRFENLQLIKNTILTGIKLIAFGVTLAVVLPFEKFLQPYIRYSSRQQIKAQVESDIAALSSKGVDVSKIKEEIKQFIAKEGLFKNKSPEKVETYTNRALSTYASSKLNYAPVVVDWAHSILETAKGFAPKDQTHAPVRVVFMARDGIPVYEIAKILQKKFTKYQDIPLSLLFVSRKVIAWAKESELNKQMVADYAKQEGIETDQKCLFIDIGFTGSMIEPIKNILAPITKDVQFGYLVSHTQNAKGFMANMEVPLESVRAAGQNPAVHWLEDTHQGVKNSATKLYKEEDGKIYPDLKDKNGEETCKTSSDKSYLYKHFGMKAILDGGEECNTTTPYLTGQDESYVPNQWQNASEKSKEQFNEFLMKLFTGQRKSFAKHF